MLPMTRPETAAAPDSAMSLDTAVGAGMVEGTAAVHDMQALAQAVGLSAVEAAILDFEREWWRFSGAKEQSIRERFDMTPAHYHQVLGALLDDPRALAYDPILVKRLMRLRHARHQARTARRSAS